MGQIPHLFIITIIVKGEDLSRHLIKCSFSNNPHHVSKSYYLFCPLSQGVIQVIVQPLGEAEIHTAPQYKE
jgi:hypothetical protein